MPWAQRELDYPSAWPLGHRGSGVSVAVIDTGVAAHTLLPRLTSIGDDVRPPSALPIDCDGHGTVVAGIIGASPDAASGFAGVAPGVRLLSYRQTSQFWLPGAAQQTLGTLDTLAHAIRVAVLDHAEVINISVSTCQRSDETELIRQLRYARHRDVVVVIAAGNLSAAGAAGCTQQNAPGAAPVSVPSPAHLSGRAGLDNVITVGAMTEQGTPATFSIAGPWVDVAAPGTDLESLSPVQRSGVVNRVEQNEQVQPIEGTSFAAPFVAGTAALVRRAFPHLSAARIVEQIERTAQHPAADGGRSDYVGYGMVDPRAAVSAPPVDGAVPTSAVPANGALPPVRHRWVARSAQAHARSIALAGSAGALGTVALLCVAAVGIRRVRRR